MKKITCASPAVIRAMPENEIPPRYFGQVHLIDIPRQICGILRHKRVQLYRDRIPYVLKKAFGRVALSRTPHLAARA